MPPEAELLDHDLELPAAPMPLAEVDRSLAVSLASVEIDKQIATARQFPRALRIVTSRIFDMATLDKESADECMYALPRGKGADRKAIMGPSIRFAEILKQSYGNCRAAARVVEVNRLEMYVEAEGVFHDLETNSATSARVRRRIVDSKGRLYSDDMIIVTGNAACSIALRNAILGGVPKPLWRRAYEAVQATIRGDIKTLSERRLEAVKAFAAFGVSPEQVFEALGVAGGEDIGLDHIPVLRGMFAALKNGEATVEEMFAPPAKPGPQVNTSLSDRLGRAKDAGKSEGLTTAHGGGEPQTGADLDATLNGDQVPTSGGQTGASSPSEDPPAEQTKTKAPLTQRIDAFKTLVDEAETVVAAQRLRLESKPLFDDVDKADPDEVGTVQELEAYVSERCAAIEAADEEAGR